MAKGFGVSLPFARWTGDEAPAIQARASDSKSNAFRPLASRAFGEVLLWQQEYPKTLREHRRADGGASQRPTRTRFHLLEAACGRRVVPAETVRAQAPSNRPAMATALPWQWFQASAMVHELRLCAIAGKALLGTLVMTIAATEVPRIRPRSERRNAFEVEGGIKTETTPKHTIPTGSALGATAHKGPPE